MQSMTYLGSPEQDTRALKRGFIFLAVLAALALFCFWRAWSVWESPREKIEKSMESVVVIDVVSNVGAGASCAPFEVSDLSQARPGETYDSKLYLRNITSSDISVQADMRYIWAGMLDSEPSTVFNGDIPADGEVTVDYSVSIPEDASPDTLRMLVESCLKVQSR